MFRAPNMTWDGVKPGRRPDQTNYQNVHLFKDIQYKSKLNKCHKCFNQPKRIYLFENSLKFPSELNLMQDLF